MTQILSISSQYPCIQALSTPKGFFLLACFNVSSYCVDTDSIYLVDITFLIRWHAAVKSKEHRKAAVPVEQL